MKRIILTFIIFALSGCMLHEIEEEAISIKTTSQIYTAMFDESDTKVYVDTDLKLHWNSGDEISIFNSLYNKRYRFDGQDGDRKGTFTLVGDNYLGAPKIATTIAVYPYSDETTVVNSELIAVTLPSIQSYAENSFGLGANTMVAVAENQESDKLFFKNLCGYLVVRLYGVGVVKSISLTGNNGEKISGRASVEVAFGENPSLSMYDNAGTTITLDCGAGITLDASPENAKDFWFVIPPVQFTQGFTVMVNDGNSIILTKRMGAERTIARNVKTSLVLVEVPPLTITFDSSDLDIMHENETREIHYSIASESDDITVEAFASGKIEAEVVNINAKTGALQVKTGASIDKDSKVVVLVANGSQAIMRTLRFMAEAIEVETNTTKEVSYKGGEVTLEFFSNIPCQIVIPEDAQNWINTASKVMAEQNNKIIVAQNSGFNRSAVVNVIGQRGGSNIVLSYNIIQEVGGDWRDGIVPPDDEIWYSTSNNEPVFGVSNNSFDQNIISNTYINGKGIIKLAGTVKVLKHNAFDNSFTLTNIFLPDSIEQIEYGAFLGGEIDSFYIPSSLKSLTGRVFSGCRVRRFIGDSRVSDNGLFVSEDGHIKIIASSGETTLKIPGTYETIDEYALWARNPELKHLVIEDGITDIGTYAFSGCKELETVRLPQTMTNPTGSIFAGCDNISHFEGPGKYVSSNGKTLYRYIPIGNNELKLINAVAKAGLTDYTVAEDVDGIDPESFCRAYDLKTLTVNNQTLYISGDTFDECYKLERIMGPGVTSDNRGYVGSGSFIECTRENAKLLIFAGNGITDYVVEDCCAEIGPSAFAYKPDLKTIKIADDIIRLGATAFYECDKLEEVTLPANLQYIGYSSFMNCPQLRTVFLRSHIPPKLERWGTQINDIFDNRSFGQLRIYVPEESVDLYKSTFPWNQYESLIYGKNYSDYAYYVSTDYSSDGTTTVLQQSTTGAGINIVLMGDAFSDRQIADGTYANVMQKAMNAFFSEEPYKSMKDRFNVYTVNVVSATEGYEHSGQALGTGHSDGANVYGNDSKVIEYAKKAVSEDRMDDALIIVMMNEDAYAGTCYMYNPPSGNYGRGLSIAYFPTSSNNDTFNGLVSHEAGGHGFAKLADEYAYEYLGAIPDDVVTNEKAKMLYGWWKNVDFTSDPAKVKWNQFLSDPRYANEGLGCFEGGLTYWTGVWRPSENSIMRYNTGGFNAPSRYAIWYRIGKLAYGENWEGSYEDFVAYDQVNRTPAAEQKCQARAASQRLTKPLPPLPPPVVVGHSWREELQKNK